MRPTCVDCSIKHLAQASILLQESRHGYPDHVFYARGHMAEAEAELADLYPDYSDLVRTERKLLEQNPDYTPDFMGMMEKIDVECEVCALSGNPRSVDVSCKDKILSCVRTGRTLSECQAIVSCPEATRSSG